MKSICCFLILMVLIASSCAPTKTVVSPSKKREIAMATLQQGIEFYNTGKYIMALKKLLEAEKTIPQNAELHNGLGLVYLAKDRPDLALTHFKKAIKLDPEFIDAKNNLGAVYLKLEQWDDAVKLFEEVSENLLYATPEVPISNLGWVYFNQKQYDKAKAYFQKALDISPNYLVPIHGLASVYIATGYQYQAIDFLHRMLKKSPGAAILHSDLAKAYESVNRFELAKRSWQVVLKLEPENSPLAKEAEKRLLDLR